MSFHYDFDTRTSPSSTLPPARISQRVGIGSHVVCRDKLVNELIARVESFGIIRVNGTPASGKSTVMNLMINKLLEKHGPATPIYAMTGWQEELVRRENGWASYLEKETGIHGRNWPTHQGYLLLDEAQQSYWDQQLWADLFKAIEPTSKARIVLFMSYGSPTRGFTGFEGEKNQPTPINFSTKQQISLKPDENVDSKWKPVGLLLDEDETNEVVERYALALIPNCSPILTQDLKHGLFLSTNGHVGLITSLTQVLNLIPALHILVRKRQQIDWSTMSTALFSDPLQFFKTIQNLPFARGLPPPQIIQKHGPACVLKEAIACDGIYELSYQNKSKEMKNALKNIWANGWLYAEKSGNDIHFVFATQIHRWYCQCLFWEKRPDNKLNYNSPLELAVNAIKRFQPRQLSDAPRSLAGNSLPLEDQYQKEFYCCLFYLLNGHLIMSPEFVIKTGIKGGTIDFLISQKKWGLELLRDRDRLLQHMERFEPNGQYFSLIQQNKMEQYVVLDFTNIQPQKPRPEFHGRLYHVLFSENFREVRVIHASDLSEVDSFVLMENGNPLE